MEPEVREAINLANAMKRLTATNEWRLYTRALDEIRANLEPILRQIVTDEESVRRLAYVQGQLAMLDQILDFPQDCVGDAAEELAAFQRKEGRDDGKTARAASSN